MPFSLPQPTHELKQFFGLTSDDQRYLLLRQTKKWQHLNLVW